MCCLLWGAIIAMTIVCLMAWSSNASEIEGVNDETKVADGMICCFVIVLAPGYHGAERIVCACMIVFNLPQCCLIVLGVHTY